MSLTSRPGAGRSLLLVAAVLAIAACSSDSSGPGGTVGLDAGGMSTGAGGSGGGAGGAGGTAGAAGTGVAGSGAAGAGGAAGSAGTGGAGGAGGSAGTGGAGGAAGGLGCLEILMCVSLCADGDNACVERCLNMGTPQGLQNVVNLASCSQRFNCGPDDACIQRNCAAELRDCSGGGAGGPPTRERLIGRWWNSPTGNLYNWYTFSEQGQYSYEAATGRVEMGPFTVQGDQLTLTPAAGGPRRYTFGFECVGGDALLNLTDATGLKVGYWRHVDSPGGKSGGFCQ